MRESVKLFNFNGLERLDLSRVIMLRKITFYNHLSVTDNSILSVLFWSYLHDYFNIDNCHTSVFKPVSAAMIYIYIYELFDQCVMLVM